MKPFRVLVVDDEPGIRELIHDTLSRRGHAVVCAANGVEAVALLAQGQMDIVFLDIRMPNGDGLTALHEIRRLWPSLPVVMITGCGQQEAIDQSLALGPLLCLIKPFSMRDVIGMLGMLS